MDRIEAVRFYGPRDVRRQSIPRVRSLGKNQVRIRVLAAGICGSDLHVYETGSYVTQIPVTMGHEFCGRVLETGEEVGPIRESDHVIGDSRGFCGRCAFCLQQKHNLCDNLGFLGEVCDGAFAEEIVVDFRSVLRISPDVPVDIAALAEPVAVCLHALEQVELSPTSEVLVMGGGPIGALLSVVLSLRGFSRVSVAERSEFRRSVLSKTESGRVLEEIDQEYGIVFETTGSRQVLSQIMPHLLAKGGRAVIVGIYRDSVLFNFTDLVEKEWQFRGSSVFTSELPESVKLLEQNWKSFDWIVTHKFSLDEFDKAFDLVLDPRKRAMKVVFMPDLGSR
jgi:(R,R)-butanediol dehydrogenase/meso-butanediol dehydrogenase/diacetyl reductase